MEQTMFFRRTYDETLNLMVEARNYLAHVEGRRRPDAGPVAGLLVSCEAMRVTSRLTQVMAWLMIQRAAQEGEIDAQDALADRYRLSGSDVCRDERFSDDEALPRGLKSLLERSLHLYERVARIEEEMVRKRLH